jgi:hypothetical protein
MNLEAVRRMDNVQEPLDFGDTVRVRVKKKFDKNYIPNWTEKKYIVTGIKEAKDADLPWLDASHDPQEKYTLEPKNGLPAYKKNFFRHELLLTEKA